MKIRTIIICVFSAILFLTGCERAREPVSKTDFVMDTVAIITVYDDLPEGEAEKLIDQCFSKIREYERLFSAEIPDSDISRINDSAGEPVKVSEESIDLIDTALYYSSISDGAFDITIRPVSKLWDFRSGEKNVPDDKDINEALKHVGYGNILLDKENLTVTLKDPEAEIDPGAIAKGFTGDRVKELLLNKGVRSAVINLGGNVVLIGSKPDGTAFKVGVEKPFGKENEMIKTLEEKDKSIVTSGDYERYFIKDDKLYHHILDTKTGYPVDSGLDAVTVISPLSVDGDALSTMCFCLGKEKSEELLKEIALKDTRIYYVDAER